MKMQIRMMESGGVVGEYVSESRSSGRKSMGELKEEEDGGKFLWEMGHITIEIQHLEEHKLMLQK
jgi:hypothetical protein